MRHTVGVMFGVLLAVSSASAWAQSAPPTDATDVTRADVDLMVERFPGGGDQQLRVADAGSSNVGIAIVRWAPGERGVLIHTRVTEVYYMLEGTGTLVTGGGMPGGTVLDSETLLAVVGPTTAAS